MGIDKRSPDAVEANREPTGAASSPQSASPRRAWFERADLRYATLALLCVGALALGPGVEVRRGVDLAGIALVLLSFRVAGQWSTLLPAITCSLLVLSDPLLAGQNGDAATTWETLARLGLIWLTALLVRQQKLRDAISGPGRQADVPATGFDTDAALEHRLRDTETRLRDLVDGSIHGIYVLQGWKPVFANQAFADMLGFDSVAEVLQLDSVEAFIDPTEIDRLRAGHGPDPDAGEPTADYEILARRKDGSPIVLRNLARSIAWQGQAATQNVVIDVTETRAMHLALKHEEDRFREFAEIAADWFWETDDALRFTYVSGRVEEFTAHNAENLLGTNLLDLFANQSDKPETLRRFSDDLAARRAFRGVEIPVADERGMTRIIRSNGRPLVNPEGRFLGYRGVGQDSTVEHHMARKVAHQATHDSLTGLANRLEFEERLARALSNAKRDGTRHALCYLDLDLFKTVNDTAGHVAGDELLRQLTGLLLRQIRKRDTLARLGGDEFALLLENCTIEKAMQIAEALLLAVNQYRFVWEGRRFEIGVSIGVIPIDAAALNTVQLLAQADAACYTAKDLGRRQVYSPSADRHSSSDRQAQILRATELRDALDNDRCLLYCLPIVSLGEATASPPRYEMLLRIRDQDDRVLAPGAYIAAAERYGIMTAIDRWVISSALTHFSGASWLANPPQISINLSANSLSDDNLLNFVRQQIQQSRLRPENICFEFTETAAIGNLARATVFIDALRAAGCRFALDDFGSGVSSFSYLKSLTVDYLKIDGSFVRNLIDNPVDRATVSAINQVGHVMGIQTVAEFVESAELKEQLRGMDVDYGQGYGLFRPSPLAEIVPTPRSG